MFGGHGASHVVARPRGQLTLRPVTHVAIAQSEVPAFPSGQRSTQLAPGKHVALHGPPVHVSSQVLFAPHMAVPSANAALQRGLFPAHATLHGGASHSKSHAAPSAHVQSPSAHAPLQLDIAPQETEHGAVSHSNVHDPPAAHEQSPSAQCPSHVAPDSQPTLHGGAAQVN